MANYSTFPGLSAKTKSEIYNNLSPRPYCSNDFNRQGLVIRPKQTAFEYYAHIQLNNHWSEMFLLFDIDYCGAAWAWDDVDILAPTFATVNPKNWHAHLGYGLITPVWKQGSNKPKQWLQAIRKDLAEILGADRGFHGLTTKNPNHPRWRVLDFGGYNELVELSEAVEMYKRRTNLPRPMQEQANQHGESNFLFNDGRFYGYWIVRKCATHSVLYDRLKEYLERRSVERREPIRKRHIDYMVKYLTDWIWQRRDRLGRSGRHERKTTDGELRERQIQSAHGTAAIKRAATEEKIRTAIDKFLRAGKRISKASIAREIGVSRELVYRYYAHLF